MTNWWRNIEWAAIVVMLLGFLAAWKWSWFSDHAARRPGWVLVLEIALVVIFLVTFGKSNDGTLLGVLIDEADRVSLGRLQMFLWIVVLYAGLATALTVNLARDCRTYPEGTDPPAGKCAESIFSIEVPTDMLKLVGITMASGAVSGLVIFQGLNRTPRASVRDRGAEQLDGTDYEARGIIAARPEATEATLADTMRGSFVTDAPALDLSKVQFLVLTLLLAGAYLVAFAQGMSTDVSTPLGSFPAFDDGLINLLAISAAAYAGIKVLKDASLSG